MSRWNRLIETIHSLLFIDQKTQQVSHTKFWSNVGYGCMSYTFVYAVLYGSQIDVMLWALFGLVVVGNHSVIHLFGRNQQPHKEEEQK